MAKSRLLSLHFPEPFKVSISILVKLLSISAFSNKTTGSKRGRRLVKRRPEREKSTAEDDI